MKQQIKSNVDNKIGIIDSRLSNTLYNMISHYRVYIMGISIIWVALYHCWFKMEMQPLKYIKQTGFIGVDLFFIISGFGIAHSLEKNKLKTYYINRMKRLLPTYYVYVVIRYSWEILMGDAIRIKDIIGSVTFTGWFLNFDNQMNWYVYAIVWIYIAAPLIYKAFKKSKNKKLALIVLVLIVYTICPLFFGKKQIMAIARIPMFILGMYIGLFDKDKVLKKNEYIFKAIIGTILFAISNAAMFIGRYEYFGICDKYGILYYICGVMAPILIMILAILVRVLLKINWLKYICKFIEMCGKASLEILLFQTFIYSRIDDKTKVSNIHWWGYAVAAILFGLVYSYIMKKIIKKLEEKKKGL